MLHSAACNEKQLRRSMMPPVVLVLVFILVSPTVSARDGLLVPRATLSVSDILDNSPKEQCGPQVAAELYNCCGDKDVYASPNTSLAGALPANFTPARVSTDLSNNLDLCGVITQLPLAAGQQGPVTDATPPLNITNTKIRLDLAKLSSDNPLIAPQIAKWLADGALNASNLNKTLDASAAYQMCTILQHDRVQVVQANYCKQGQGNCTCTAKAQTSSVFPNNDAWDACHVTLLDLKFDNPIQQAGALAQYNSYIMSKGLFSDAAGFACGDAGWQYRRRVALLVTLVPAGVCAVVLAVMWCCTHTCAVKRMVNFLHGESTFTKFIAKCFGDSAQKCYTKLLPIVMYLVFHVYDTVSDWQFVLGVARTGNAHAVMLLGWLFLGTQLAPGLLLWFTLAAALYDDDGDDSDDSDDDSVSGSGIGSDTGSGGDGGKQTSNKPQTPVLVRILLVLQLSCPVLVAATACILCGLGSSTINRFAGDGTILVAEDATFLAFLFLGFSLAGKVAMLLLGAVGKILLGDKDEVQDAGDYILARVTADVTFAALVGFPQLVTQSVLWVRGWVMLDTATYVMSAVGSTMSILWCMVTLFTGSIWHKHHKPPETAAAAGDVKATVTEPEVVVATRDDA